MLYLDTIYIKTDIIYLTVKSSAFDVICNHLHFFLFMNILYIKPEI